MRFSDRWKKEKAAREATSPWVSVRVRIPRHTYKEMMKLATAKQVPLTYLMQYAVDYALDHHEAFDCDYELPDDYVEFAYASECKQLIEVLRYFEGGIGVDQLIMMRRGFKMEKSVILAAIAELCDKEIAHLTASSFKPISKSYPNYMVLRLASDYLLPVAPTTVTIGDITFTREHRKHLQKTRKLTVFETNKPSEIPDEEMEEVND